MFQQKAAYRISGANRGCTASTPSDVDIMKAQEFLESYDNESIAQHIDRIVNSAHHCVANTYGNYLYGAILIPVEEFDATDGAYDRDIAFAPRLIDASICVVCLSRTS